MTCEAKPSWKLAVIYFYVLNPGFRGETIFLSVLERRSHFIGNPREEAPFNWVYLRDGGRWIFAGCWLELHFMVQALFGGLVV